MLFQKKIDYHLQEILVYFVDQDGRKQGTLKAYFADKNKEIREELLLYTQEYKDGETIEGKRDYFYSK